MGAGKTQEQHLDEEIADARRLLKLKDAKVN